MKQAVALLSLILLIVNAGNGQTRQDYRPLSVWNAVQVNSPPADSIAPPIKCDGSGNILTRFVDGSDVSASGVLRISSDGKNTLTFAVRGAPDLKGPRIIDFTSSGGVAYLLVQDQDGAPSILKYRDDGQLLGEIKLDPLLRPSQIAVFDSGNFVLAGSATPSRGAEHARAPENFIGLFTSDGKLIRKIVVPGDIQTSETANTKRPDRKYQFALAASVLVVGDDGLAYLMRRTNAGPVFQISPAGVVTKVLKLTAPDSTRNSGLLLVRQGYIVTEFLEFKPGSNELQSVVLKLINIDSGDTVATLAHSDPRIGSSLACYDGQAFVFLAVDDSSRLQLLRTTYSK